MNITDGTIKDYIDNGNGLKEFIRELRTEIEESAVDEALRRTNGSEKDAAKLLQISYSALRYMAGKSPRPKHPKNGATATATRKVKVVETKKKR